MWDAAVWTVLVISSVFAFYFTRLFNGHERLHHDDAVELRRRQRMMEVLRENIYLPRRTLPPGDTEEGVQPPKTATAAADAETHAEQPNSSY
jgi:hypothetical protein